MPEKKAAHYATHHHVGPFAKGQVVAAGDLEKWIGVEKDASDEEKAAAREAGVKRLLDLGAITEAEAPEGPKPAEETKPVAPRPAEPRPAEHPKVEPKK